jgi:predicted RecA/RadA family phage recombinase
MATNFLQQGDFVTVAAPSGGVSSGDLVIVGAIAGIALTDADATKDVNLQTRGVFTLPKLSTEVITQGAAVSWDIDPGQVVLPDSGHYPLGTAIEAAGNGDTTVAVRLDGVATAAAA